MAESLEDVQGKILAREAKLREEQDKELCKLLRAELVQLREKEIILLRRQEGAAGNSGQAGPGGGAAAGPPFKRIKMPQQCSELAQPSNAEPFIPGCLSNSRVAFYAGRQHGVALNVAPPALLCAPEVGIVHDAAHSTTAHSMALGESDMDAARALCKKMSKRYASEGDRQKALVKWFNKRFHGCGSMVVPEKRSASTEGGAGANGGQVVAQVKGCDYLLAVLEIKNESGQSGDPMFQACGYYQRFYRDGERWHAEYFLRASGAPAFTLELQGCDLVIGAVYTVEGNVVAREPLTDKMTLLDVGTRMRVYVERLARVLAAFRAAMLLLNWRIKQLAGCEGLESSEEICSRTLAFLPPSVRQDVAAAMQAASLSTPRMAGRPHKQPAGQTGDEQSLPWARLPYPLASVSAYPGVESLPSMAFKAAFKCSQGGQAGSASVLAKFGQWPYPVKVHKQLQALDLTPSFINAQRLPGGWWMVEQEFLDAPWCTFDSFLSQRPPPSRERQEAAADAVATAVSTMHSAGIVHGDLRPPNVLLSERAPNTFEVKLIDLEWAGVLDEAPVYPLNMAPRSSSLPWHGTAGPGRALEKDHDKHLLQQLFYPPKQHRQTGS